MGQEMEHRVYFCWMYFQRSLANDCQFLLFVVIVVGGCVCSSSFGFADMELFSSCVFIGVLNLLGLEFSF